MSIYTFDQLTGSSSEQLDIKPFHTVASEGDDAILHWLKDTSMSLRKEARGMHERMLDNHALHLGIKIPRIGRYDRSQEKTEDYVVQRYEKIIINHLFDITETRVSQLTRLKASIEALPGTDEVSDKRAARAVEKVLKYHFYINNMDKLRERMHRGRKIYGWYPVFILWDKNKGDYHPNFVPGMPYIDANGSQVIGRDGKPVTIKKAPKIGEVSYEAEVPWRVLFERTTHIDKSDYVFRLEYIHVDKLKQEYPDKAYQIKPEVDAGYYDTELNKVKRLKDHVLVARFWHRHTLAMPQGYYAKFTPSVILESQDDLGYSHGKLPVVYTPDIDVEDSQFGMSWFEMLRPIQNVHSNITSMLTKNIYLMAHAKWMMPRGAAKVESLGNASTIVQYSGPVAPQQITTQPNPPEAYSFRNQIKNELEQISGVHGVSRGEPPKGITAAVALQYLNDQETERASTDISSDNYFVEAIARMGVAVAGDYYKPDDGRMIRLIGKDGAAEIEAFDTANLSKSYDIRVKGSSALPESKAGKIQRIIEMMQYKPDLLPNEQWVELMEFGNTDQMHSLITEAVRAAESENEDLLQGLEVAEPQDWEDSIIHWRTHVQTMQKRSFKETTPANLQDRFLAHLEITEYQMIEKAKVNPKFQAKLAELELFPIVFKMEKFIPTSAEQQLTIAQGQANRGEPVTATIPGNDPAKL